MTSSRSGDGNAYQAASRHAGASSSIAIDSGTARRGLHSSSSAGHSR
jgi:hypothetical protein